MLRLSLLSLCLALPFAVQAQEKVKDELAYSLGTEIGARLKTELPDLKAEDLLRGLRDAYNGEPLALDKKRIDELVAQHNETVILESEEADAQQAKAAEARFLVNEKTRYGVKELDGGVLVSVIHPGTGPLPKPGGDVQVRYVGKLPDDSVFDEQQTPQWFKLSSVIPGWQTALVHMPVGSTWRIVVPSAQAYGDEGAGDLIPPYAPLVFEVTLDAVR
ncbi:FKBP-type peptidyl-prolyl cis-trans isomerase FklB [Pseudomonas duriflava]|uniref:Peptidyl-prolyl cis-trans isomerase n=1 Tax=Pseudomonas duriflava TaxID=459528 RepID=A0A562QMC6_9PSED|nr:FKBP-type peptidyl-prolyl cis-trans isomerase [Pseudomonas duriflava]TWI57350.1 FKBP-type peptidyl-prolyl cis-trans isomerase FklB [Pseudomonas duriflava]